MKSLNILSLFLIACLFYLSFKINSKFPKKTFKISKQEEKTNLHNNLIKIFSLGQERLLSSYFWVETMLSSDLEHYNKKDGNSWMFHRFNTITDLDPKFLDPYLYGGLYLSIIKNDKRGAEKIYEKGLSIYPSNFHLNFNHGFHSYFELQNEEKALKSFTKILNHPKAPSHLTSIVARISANKNDLNNSFQLILEAYKSAPKKSLLRKRLWDDLYAIRSEIDLKCLNVKKVNCNRLDFEGRPYLYLNGKYKAQRKYEIYRLKSKRAP